ncbi:MAG: hypothetical protein JSS53_05260 [Proteobacteria bacterium]|nr:hypothetical protein [Pseudomonadota bacterium]
MQHAKSAIVWITNILEKLNIPFQIAGGLAARAYGSTRKLEDIDIDIPEDKFYLVKHEVSEFIVYGPERYKDEIWDVMLMTLNYNGQLIDLSGAYHTKIWNAKTKKWQELITDFSKAQIKNIFGIQLPVISCDELISYKKILSREVDIKDIEMIDKK